MSNLYYEVTSSSLNPTAVLQECVENDCRSILLAEGAFGADFVDLNTGLAGELLHKLSTYRMRLAGIVPKPADLPMRFQEFMRESNRGDQFRFFPTRQEAIDWLATE
ncbi:MAG: DUF4180 domain-containing protein [Caldilineaceae bacterium]|nr:DUF4180 domain-containing protein [Caldilineaceae bacterium]